ncbi:MAG: CidA/LrgA family protein [Firmicutes bacterium]|nr:CidA/LrgA family protein [Bacillota bacterium]
MKYLKQFMIIIGISFFGELLHYFIPLPIPASIYGMVLLFAGLVSGIIPLAAVKETGTFLVAIMPVMFIPAAAGLLDMRDILRDGWVSYLVITFITTVLVMAAVGLVVQMVMKRGKRGEDAKNAE